MKFLENGHLGGCILYDQVGDINTWTPRLWDDLIKLIDAKSIIDVGCGVGYSLQYFKNKGISAIGIDGLEDVLTHSPVPELITIHDYTKDKYVPDRIIDLAWSCEFVEHIEENFVENFMKTFDMCRYVGMTHALPNQPGYHHVNCQLPEYWINLFTIRGFKYMNVETKILKDSIMEESYGHWVKNSFMLFKNEKLGKSNVY